MKCKLFLWSFTIIVLGFSPLVNSYSFLPVQPTNQGHKRHLPEPWLKNRISYNEYSEECQARISVKNAWNGGAALEIRVKEVGEKAMKDWSLEINFDRDVKSYQSYDGPTEQISSKKFVVTPAAWSTEIPQEQAKVVLGQFTWPPDTDPAPSVTRIVLNGRTISCTDESDDEALQIEPVVAEEAPAVPAAPVPTPGTAPTPSPAPAPAQAPAPAPSPIAPAPENSGPRGVFVPWPKKVMGLYILLADDSEEGYESDAEWDPKLYPYQQEGANVLFFTFVHPGTMEIPPAFQKLAKTRGTNVDGAVPADTVILFAIGGYAYSINPNPWHWLKSKEAAEAMAEKVAEWPEKYGCDGIDLDIEDGAGDAPGAGPNMVHFVRKLRELSPKMIIGQPTYGFPQIKAEIEVINESWDADGNSKNMADSIGLMVYEGTNSLNYVKNYVSGSSQWSGFPIKVNAPSNTILLGAKGSASPGTIGALADAAIAKDYLGVMVWYGSVRGGLHYAVSWDASLSEGSQQAYVDAMTKFRNAM